MIPGNLFAIFFLNFLKVILFYFSFISFRQNKWVAVSPMSTRRKHLGCAVFNNYIYAVGGRDDCMELSSAERYNPHTNTWSPIVAMTSRRSGVSIQQFIYKCYNRYNLNESILEGLPSKTIHTYTHTPNIAIII